MRIIDDPKLDFKDVLIVPKRSTLSSRKEVSLTRSIKFRNVDATFIGTPIIAANMDGVGTFNMAKALFPHTVPVALHKHYSYDQLIDYFADKNFETTPTFYSLGVVAHDLEKFYSVKQALITKVGEMKARDALRYVCIDVANGYSEQFVKFVRTFRKDNPHTVIMAGNVVTAEMTEELILSGADIVKVGIGPGSVCTTRKITGVGYPQLSAIIECADAAHGLGGHICGDGGCVVPGDVAKAFGAGADFVMLGGMLAGHTESEAEIIHKVKQLPEESTVWTTTGALAGGAGRGQATNFEVETLVRFYGMSSKTAMEKHSGGVAEYRASEGKEVLIPYKGSVDQTIKEILGGLRSACTYTGSRTLKELPKRTTFIKVTQQINNSLNQHET